MMTWTSIALDSPRGRGRLLRVSLSALALLLSLCLPAAHPATVTLGAAADAFVTNGGTRSGSNFGMAGLIGVSAAGRPNGEFQSVLRFDFSAAKTALDAQFGAGHWLAQSITLQLTLTPNNNGIFNVPAAGQFGVSWMQNDSWAEGTGKPNAPTTDGISFNSLPTYLGSGDQALGTFSYDGSTSGTRLLTLTLASGLVSDLMAGNLASLRFAAADANVSALFNSHDYTMDASARPVMTIIAVPEPTASALGLAGVFLVLGRRRRT